MKALLFVALVAVVVLLMVDNASKKKNLEQMQEVQRQAEAVKHRQAIDEQLRELRTERDKLKTERDQARVDLDQANQDLSKANQDLIKMNQELATSYAEITRLTGATPKPATWFEKRIQDSTNRLEAPPSPAGAVRSRFYYAPINP